MARKAYIKTLKYCLSLGSSFANTPKIVNHEKFSMGNNKKIAFIPRFAIPKSFLARGYEEKKCNYFPYKLARKKDRRTGKKKKKIKT